MSLLYFDLETRSSIDLRKANVYRYVEDDQFAVLMCAYSLDGGPVQVAIGRDEVLAVPGLLDPAVRHIAHNSNFDRVCLSALSGVYQDPESYDDTAARAAEYGLPRSLKALSEALGCTPKDEAGTRLINLFCKPRKKDGGWNGPESHPEDWQAFVDYCIQDVGTMVECDARMPGWPSAVERRAWVLDQHVNDRGLTIDWDLARLAVKASEVNAARDRETFTALTGVENPGSQPQVMAWAAEAGLTLPNLQADTITAALERDDLDPAHREVLALRQSLALASTSKYAAALDGVCADGRIRGNFQFFGAHTGRWSGRGVQLQNLPRAAFQDDDEVEEALASLRATGLAEPITLKKLIRPMLTGPFTVVDLAQIEARVLAWLSGEDWVLQAFREKRDLYVETAERMSTPERPLGRQQGKVAVLALGYGGGVGALRQMGADGTDEELQVLVDLWRKANPRTVRFWANLQDCFAEGGRAGRIRVTRRNDTMRMVLPSDRAIHYYGLRFDRFEVENPAYEDDLLGVEPETLVRTSWRYRDPAARPGVRVGLYGGRAAENVTQAVARDVLTEGMVRLDRLGYRIVGHVHDEVIIEGTHDVEEVVRLLCELPPWAEGLPVDAEGFQSFRYKK